MIQDIDGHEAKKDAERVAETERCVAAWINGDECYGKTQRDISAEYEADGMPGHFIDYRYAKAAELVGG